MRSVCGGALVMRTVRPRLKGDQPLTIDETWDRRDAAISLRRRKLERFRASHNQTWVCFHDLGEYVGRGAYGPEIKTCEKRRAQVFEELAAAIANGVFDVNGRTQVLCLIDNEEKAL